MSCVKALTTYVNGLTVRMRGCTDTEGNSRQVRAN